MSDGEKIRELRKQKKMTQEELAARVGVTKAQISAIELGVRVLSVPVAKAIASALDCSIADLVG